MLPFKIEELQAAVAEGSVTARPHPYLPYTIYNYAKEIQWLRAWDDVTLNCRGLILDDEYNIIARPWKKFFNLGEVELPIQFDDPVEVMDKADGSLGILYPTGGGYAIATRGSFESEQAIMASKIWREQYAEYCTGYGIEDVFNQYTYLFEIVGPSNRIVLEYEKNDLVLLGAVEKSTGYYYGPREAAAWIDWPGPVVKVFPHKNISEALEHMGRKGAEGYVIRSHNFMVKLKEPDYVDLHRLVTNANPKTVWEQLAAGKSKTEIISQFPDEFHSYIESMIDPLLEKFNYRASEILNNFHEARERVEVQRMGDPVINYPTRAEYAKEFKKSKDAGYYFLLLDDRSDAFKQALLKEIKPKATDDL